MQKECPIESLSLSIYIYDMSTRMPVDRGHSRKVILTIIVYQAGVYPFHSIPSVRPSIHPIHPPILSIHPSFPFIYISIYLAICSPICLSTYLSTNLSSYLSFDPSIYRIYILSYNVAILGLHVD